VTTTGHRLPADSIRTGAAPRHRAVALTLVGSALIGACQFAASRVPEPLVDAAVTAPVHVRPSEPLRELLLTVRNGDSLSRLFAAHGLSAVDLESILMVGGPTARLISLRPGDAVRVRARGDGSIVGLTAEIDETNWLEVERAPRGFAARTVERPIERRIVYAHGTIGSSLFASAVDAGLSGALTMSLAGVFGYDIDFLQDLRSGDRFAVMYEQLWRDGEKLRDGGILAATFENDGRELTAVRWTRADGRAEYFAADGSSMRKALTRNPVDFTRVSSGFSSARRHPILNRVRAHQGVDYAAPAGTPVRAAGDGKVVFRGLRGGYGNAIVIQHGATYSTLYGHMALFGRGIYVGGRVVQDQVIGYVGMTGLATAPHLHYEVLVNGVHRNPRTVVLPDAAPLAPAERAAFAAEAAMRLRELARSAPDQPQARATT
jgi:murein DD-endopeptidase MepM/ murein hydrolase activator NlpD